MSKSTSAIKRFPRYFQSRFVAFVDILDFTDIVERMIHDYDLLVVVRDSLKRIYAQSRQFKSYRRARQSKPNEESVTLLPPTDLQMTAFSDCYVISEQRPVWHVLAAVQALGSNLLSNGILCRGSVVQGGAYHKGGVLFGPAIIEAYNLERHVAKYPRILVSDEVRRAAWGYHEGRCKGRLFSQDNDGCWFVNTLCPPLSKWSALSLPAGETSLRRFQSGIRNRLADEILRAEGNLRRKANLMWLVNHLD